MRAVLGDTAALAKPIRVEVVTDRRLDASELDLIRSRLHTVYSRPILNPATQQRELVFASLEGAAGGVAFASGLAAGQQHPRR